nr:hypothetical protein [Candidatus Saccharibacteria bacterium]
NSGHGPVDVVADLIGTRPGDALSAINARKLDTRNGRPLNIPTQASCNNAGWVERYADGSTEVAVYMGATERVLRYGIAPEEVPYNFEMDPSTCNAPAIIYSAINPATGRYSIYRRDLATGAESRIATTVNPSFENTYEPDPLFDQVFFTQHVQYQRNLMSTLGKTWGSSIQEFSVNDTGTTLAAIQTYTQPLRPAPVDDYVNVMVQWTDPVTRRQVLIGHEFTRNTGEDVREIQTATDGGQVLILRSLNHNPLTSLYEVKQHPTAISPDTGLPLAVFEPITIPTIEPGEIQSYRVLAEDSIVAILDEDGVKSTVEIDLQQGIITELTPEYGALVDISM